MSTEMHQVSEQINPWQKPLSNITWGFLFTIMTFNFFYLNYILPIIGVALLFIGFYDLRKVNNELRMAWNFSIANLIFYFLNLIYTITPLHIKYNNAFAMIIFNTVFQISFLLIFRSGLKNLLQEAGITSEKDPIIWLVIWRSLAVFLAWSQLGSVWFIFFPYIFFYFYNFSSLYKINEPLKDLHIEPLEAHNKYRSKKYWCAYMVTCALIVVLVSSISNHIKLTPVEATSPDLTETRQNLIDLGFPEEMLKDIPEEQVELLKDATKIEIYRELLMFDPKVKTITTSDNGYTVQTNKEVPGKINLKATSIYVQLKDNRMYGVHYFKWQDGGAYWNDGLSLRGSVPLELIAGNLLYEKNGSNYSAPIPRLNSNIVLERDWFGYESMEEKITGAVNYPFGSEKQRGYILYEFKFNKDLDYGDIINGAIILNYNHHKHPIIVPYEETEFKNQMFSDIQRSFYTNFSRELTH